MSDELRLPDHLAACEARLAAQMLPASGINRDDLLYRAGWAAGAETARLAVASPPPSQHRGGGGTTAVWSLASAAVAASIAVMATLQWHPNEQPVVVASPADANPQLAVEADSRPSSLPRVEFARDSTKSPSNRRIESGLLGLRQRAITNAWLEPNNLTTASGDAATPTPQTARDLMQEFLPAKSARRATDWPWIRTSPGDSI